ncbi:hypothetical protein LCGC14_1369940 [marine sediment metagenome]|uniref:CopG-like ribbon-helix-helix domain-containing protein n=1 Tax=marine sediment metagenome TaxID=412755 RepID=A0A0F9MKV9_9ZZZZ
MSAPPRITIQVTEEELQALDTAAAKQGRTRSSMLRWLMNEGLKPVAPPGVMCGCTLATDGGVEPHPPCSVHGDGR